MTLVRWLRELWRRRRLVAPLLVCSCVTGVGITVASPQGTVGVASATLLIDSPKSQVADLGISSSVDTGGLAARAALLASLMASPPIENSIAQLAGVPTWTLIATPPAADIGTVAPGVQTASISSSDPRASFLRVSVPTLQAGQLPIIQVDTQAPTAARAAALANASFTALQAQVNTVATTDAVPSQQRLVVRQLGQASGSTMTTGLGPIFGILGAAGAFILGCAALIGGSSLASAWRASAGFETGADAGMHPPSDVGPAPAAWPFGAMPVPQPAVNGAVHDPTTARPSLAQAAGERPGPHQDLPLIARISFAEQALADLLGPPPVGAPVADSPASAEQALADLLAPSTAGEPVVESLAPEEALSKIARRLRARTQGS
jgi:hypothetical protein